MKYTDIKKYILGLWSPMKLFILLLVALFIVITVFHSHFYNKFCYTGTGLINSPCGEAFLTVFYVPLVALSVEFSVFLLSLFLLPSSYLYRWLKYIGSWSLPLGIGLFLLGSDGTSAPSMIGPGLFNHTGMLQIAVYSWLILLTGYILWSITVVIVATYRTK